MSLHVSMLLRHLQGARSQYLLSYINNVYAVLVIHFRTYWADIITASNTNCIYGQNTVLPKNSRTK